MPVIDGVHLRGGPCDGQRPEPLPDTTFPDDLQAITVMDHSAGVGHLYEVTGDLVIDEGVRRVVLDHRRTVPPGRVARTARPARWLFRVVDHLGATRLPDPAPVGSAAPSGA